MTKRLIQGGVTLVGVLGVCFLFAYGSKEILKSTSYGVKILEHIFSWPVAAVIIVLILVTAFKEPLSECLKRR